MKDGMQPISDNQKFYKEDIDRILSVIKTEWDTKDKSIECCIGYDYFSKEFYFYWRE